MGLPDLDDLIAEVDRTCTTAHMGKATRDQPDWVELLKTATQVAGQLETLADDLIEEYVEHCRMHGASWSDIGQALGVTRQAAQQRFVAPPKEYDSSEFSEELREAMTEMKRVAVFHRNNYIGTEHILSGVIAGRNSATALLARRGIAVDDLRRSVEDRLTLGASQAAEKIAWTPYARRVIALAKQRASRSGRSVIDCTDVLAGLVELGRGVAADVLGAAAIDTAALEDVRSTARRRRGRARSQSS